jgi:predicted ArsR family transcriptional regulator
VSQPAPHPNDLPEKRTGEVIHMTVSDDHRRVFRMVQDYGGLPLSALDINQELGISERRAKLILDELTAFKLLGTKVGTGRRNLYFVEEAL